MFTKTNRACKEFIRMNIENVFSDVLLIKEDNHTDERGFFSELYNKKIMNEIGINEIFVQDNLSFSKNKGTLRGLHFQTPPKAQSKLLRVVSGEIIDYFIDLRKESKTFEQHGSIKLIDDSGWLYIPKGFAHGFCTISDDTRVMYKVDDYYSKDNDTGIKWNDEYLNLKWPFEKNELIISDKDNNLPKWLEIKELTGF